MSDPVRIAVLGAGRWGPNLIRHLHNMHGSQVAVVADPDARRLQEVSGRFPGVRVTPDPLEALRDGAVQAVAIATPTSTHYGLAQEALERGKDVLVEKPLATSSRQAEELCALAARRGCVLMVGHVFLYHAAIRKVRHYLESQALGRVHYIAMDRTNLGPIRSDVNALWDLAAHDVSIADYWLGTPPLTAAALGGCWIHPGLADAGFVTLRYPDGVLVNIRVSWLNPRKDRRITVVCERKMLTFDDIDRDEPLRLYDKNVSTKREAVDFPDSFASFRASIYEGDITIPRLAMDEPLRTECEHFLECVRKRAAPLTDGPQGLRVVRVLEAIERSMRNSGREEAVG